MRGGENLMIRRIMILLAVTIIGLIGAVAVTTPSQAAASYITVCNHYSSVDDIMAYNYVRDPDYKTYINQGECRTNVPDTGGGARVDVDVGGSEGEVDSWRKAREGGNWGPCYNNEDESSNPYSDFNGVVTEYQTFSKLNCVR
jgi:hypothetical protein